MAEHSFRQEQLVYRVSVFVMLVLGATKTGAGDSLSYDYYKLSCPNVQTIVRKALLPIFITDPRSPAAFLRLFFHDCQVQGCDGSILLDSDYPRGIRSEMEAGRNFGIRNRESIGYLKDILELECPGKVSCADVVVMAASEAVAYSGGPRIAVPLGRMDSTTASNRKADAELPPANIGVDDSIRLFSAKGMNLLESVAILGAHTIGVGHCVSIAQRLYDANMKLNVDAAYETLLRLNCPTKVPFTNETFVINDLTPALFDNHYYKDVMSGRGLFAVDAGIPSEVRTAVIAKRFSEDQEYFFRVFSSAFVKLSLAAEEGHAGEIRRECGRVN